MKYKHKFYLLMMVAIIYNLFQMMDDQKPSIKINDPELKKSELTLDLEQSGIICTD